MASDTDASRRKHRRSHTDDVTGKDKSSKRHKHRHRRSRKHGDESKHSADKDSLNRPAVPVAAYDDDVEEGEILEEEGSADVIVKAIELPDGDFSSQNLGVHIDNGDSGLTNFNGKVSFSKESASIALDELNSRDGGHSNGDLSHGKHYKETKKQHEESSLSSRGHHKQENYGGHDTPAGNESRLSDRGKSSSLDSSGDKLKTTACSPSLQRYHDEVSGKGGSLLHDFSRERSRTLSLAEDEVVLKRRRHHEKVEYDYVDERMSGRGDDLQRSSRYVEREHSTSHNRSLGGEERHSSRDTHGRDKEMDWEQRRERGHDRAKERDQRRERERERSWDTDQRREREQERSWDRDRRREKERERSRDVATDRDQIRDKERDREIGRGHRREKQRERSWDREVDRDSRQEKQRERSWDREVDRDSRQERQRERSWDREIDRDSRKERQREKSWDRESHRAREREQSRSRDREEELDKKRDRERDRSRDKDMSRIFERHSDWEREKDSDKDRFAGRNRARDRDWKTEQERQSDRNREKARDDKNVLTKVYNTKINSLEGDRDEDEPDDFEERIALKLAEQEEDLDRIKEESRKRRQAILEKYRNKPKQQQGETHSDNVKKESLCMNVGSNELLPRSNPETINVKTESDLYVPDPAFSVGKSPTQNGNQASERASGAVGLGEGTPKSEGSDEKYCDDIFGETPARVHKTIKGDGLPNARSSFYDNWDDPDGYYGYRFGEILDGRYEIVAAQGKGVFSAVVRAKDLKAGVGEPQEVAIKIIRNKEQMYKAGQNELQILHKLAAADPENRRHCVRFFSSFKYRNHLCLVFESLHMNLREVLKKFGRNIGLKLTAVRAYAKQLFIALKHLKNCEVLHCDIKPDNMLVNEAKNILKLCDFGNAMFAGKNEITPYLVSRFYRAPEVILGLPYDHPVDIWSVGCCLYELYAGKVLFPGATNNDMLRLHMELKGPFPKKMLKKGAFVDQHFDQDLNFTSIEEDPVTKKMIKRMFLNIKPKDLGSIIMGSPGEDVKMLANFKDLLDRIFVLDPEKRLTVNQALAHPFVTGK